ncbi:MAG TPA: hypothetical protein PKU74_06960 [Candidatus Omnitrophota bacterium]|nr:hypothetical protein [Candidatus Omnitrophota bacterium]
MAKETAEQKLLKLIEATEAQDKTPSSAEPAAVRGPSTSLEAQKTLSSVQSIGLATITLPSFVGQLMNVLRDPSTLAQLPQTLSIKELNKVLLILVLLIGIYFVSDFSKGMKAAQKDIRLDETPLTAAESVGLGTVGDLLGQYVKDISQYMALVSYRNIFQPYERKVEVADEVVEEFLPNQQIAEKVNQFKLVGISWRETPDSVMVMIEDNQTQVTHFLKSGEEFQGVRVETIYADSVEFSYNGEKMNVKL